MATKNLEQLNTITTPDDADLVLVNDSSESGVDKAKSFSISALKTFLSSTLLPLAGGTMTGELVLDDLKDKYTSVTPTTGTITVDPEGYQQLTLTGNGTVTMPAAEAGKAFVILINPSTFSLSWSGVYWLGTASSSQAPSADASKNSEYFIWSNGNTWIGRQTAVQG